MGASIHAFSGGALETGLAVEVELPRGPLSRVQEIHEQM
jgi:hypothetical protein